MFYPTMDETSRSAKSAVRWLIEKIHVPNPVPYALFRSALLKNVAWAKSQRGVNLNIDRLEEAAKSLLKLKGYSLQAKAQATIAFGNATGNATDSELDSVIDPEILALGRGDDDDNSSNMGGQVLQKPDDLSLELDMTRGAASALVILTDWLRSVVTLYPDAPVISFRATVRG